MAVTHISTHKHVVLDERPLHILFCFEKSDDFICDLRPFVYPIFEGVVDSL